LEVRKSPSLYHSKSDELNIQFSFIQQEFFDMTKRMEGNHPYKYMRLTDSLEKKKAASNLRLNSLSQMFDPMIERTKKYCDLAVKNNTVALATFLHPA
jgi:hypothetical protein